MSISAELLRLYTDKAVIGCNVHHVVRGTDYTVIGTCESKVQAQWNTSLIYVGEDMQIYVRPIAQFEGFSITRRVQPLWARVLKWALEYTKFVKEGCPW